MLLSWRQGIQIYFFCKYVIDLCIFTWFPTEEQVFTFVQTRKKYEFSQFLSVLRFTGYCAKKKGEKNANLFWYWCPRLLAMCARRKRNVCVCKRWLDCKNSPFSPLHTLILSQTCTVVFIPWQCKISTLIMLCIYLIGINLFFILSDLCFSEIQT